MLYELSEVRFKSYYVVWKPSREKKEEVGEEEFKSYYVVWKPIWKVSV